MQPNPNEAPPPRRGWPISSLFFLGLSAVLAVLAVLLFTGMILLSGAKNRVAIE